MTVILKSRMDRHPEFQDRRNYDMGSFFRGLSGRDSDRPADGVCRQGDTVGDQTRLLTDAELDEVAGGYRAGPRIGTGSCFQWVPSLGSWYACNLLGSNGLPLQPPVSNAPVA